MIIKYIASAFLQLTMFTVINSQTFVIKSGLDYRQPVLSKLKGKHENMGFLFYDGYAPHVGCEYHFKNGIALSANLSREVDKFNCSEYVYEQPSFVVYNEYKAIPLQLSCGYFQKIGKSGLRIFAAAGFGVAKVRAEKIYSTWGLDGFWQVTSHTGQTYTDSVHIFYNINSEEMNSVELKGEVSTGIEYKREHYFVRLNAGMSTWLTPFERIQYRSEHTGQVNNVNQYSDGDFYIKPGYYSLGVGTGWYF